MTTEDAIKRLKDMKMLKTRLLKAAEETKQTKAVREILRDINALDMAVQWFKNAEIRLG